jgi:hypothetical protein
MCLLYQKDNTSPFSLLRTHSETPTSKMKWVLQIPIATTKKVSCCCMPVQPCRPPNYDLITTFSPLGVDVLACFMLSLHTKNICCIITGIPTPPWGQCSVPCPSVRFRCKIKGQSPREPKNTATANSHRPQCGSCGVLDDSSYDVPRPRL